MNLNQYKKIYYTDEGHWYLSKIKQYNQKSINEMTLGLLIFSKLLSSKPDDEILRKFEKFKPTDNTKLEEDIKQIKINEISRLFLSLQILENNLVDLSQMRLKNLVAYKNSDQNSNLLIFHIYKYFFIYLIFNNITFKMYIQNYK